MNPKGPVIGPLVIAGALIEEEDLSKLEKLNVKDSKLLSKKQRESLFNKIKKIAKYKILIIEPKEIDDALESDDLNLNWLEAIKTAEIINELKPNKAYLDCPSPNIKAYVSYLRKYLDNEAEIIAEHKAESKFKIVAAASILAKVIRDNEIEKIKKKYGNCGPGYTSNEITQKFLKENWDKHPEIFRRSWITWKNHKIAKQQKKLDDF